MAHVPRTAYNGTLIIDATSVQELLFDLPPGVGRSLKQEQEGVAGVLEEVPVALNAHSKTLGVDPELKDRVAQKTAGIAALRKLFSDGKKLVEVLGESIALLEDEREADFSALAETVKRVAARKDPAVAGAFEKLLKYVSQNAVKAAATRRRNAAGADAGEPADGGQDG